MFPVHQAIVTYDKTLATTYLDQVLAYASRYGFKNLYGMIYIENTEKTPVLLPCFSKAW